MSRAKKTRSSEAARNALHSIDILLDEVKRRRLLLLEETPGTVEAWSPNTPLPIATRRAIRKYNRDLLTLMDQHDIRVCPSMVLHRRDWRYDGAGRYVCRICERIAV